MFVFYRRTYLSWNLSSLKNSIPYLVGARHSIAEVLDCAVEFIDVSVISIYAEAMSILYYVTTCITHCIMCTTLMMCHRYCTKHLNEQRNSIFDAL